MRVITILWSMSASACLTLAAINFMVWFRDRKALANLFFSLFATGMAAWAFCELRMMRAGSPSEFASVLRFGQVAV
jgi:two-component system, LuxR family, sensor kinase FixL